MATFLTASLANAVTASLLALAVLALSQAWRNPFVNRGMWLAVLLKFVAPPLLLLPLVEIRPPVASQLAAASELSETPPVSSMAAAARTGELALPRSERAAVILTVPKTPATAHRPAPPVANIGAAAVAWRRVARVGLALWICGAVAIAALAVVRIVCFHRALHRAPLAPVSLQRRVRQLAARAGVLAPPLVRLTGGCSSPLVWRLGRRATILLPEQLVARLSHAETTAILAHELTHLRRRDDWFRWLELAIVCVYWWCPVSWLARRRLQEAEERCCDADVLHRFPSVAAHYAGALLAALDFAQGRRRTIVATAFAHRGSLVRRFEMITSAHRPAPPSRKLRMLLALAAAAALMTTPVALSADAADDAADGPAKQRCTIQLADGTTLEGEATMIVGQRIVFVEGAAKAGDMPKPAPASAVSFVRASPAAALALVEDFQIWDLPLAKCLEMSLQHDRLLTLAMLTDGTMVVSSNRNDIAAVDLRIQTQNRVRDVVDAYWELSFAYRDLDARKIGRDSSLATWRRVKTLARAGASGAGDKANAEAQARSQYFLFRSQVESALTNLYRVENRLRYGLGISASDGRLIRPADEPTTEQVHFDGPTIHAEALAGRVELERQRRQVKQRELELIAARNQVQPQLDQLGRNRSLGVGDKLIDSSRNDVTSLASDSNALEAPTGEDYQKWELGMQFAMPIGLRRALTTVRNHQLLLDRERAVLQDLELEISHQLGDAVRDVDQNYGVVLTNFNRRAAADDEVEAVETLYDAGQIAIDRVLDAQARQADAANAYNRSLVDHARAVMRVHHRKGTLLATHRIETRDRD